MVFRSSLFSLSQFATRNGPHAVSGVLTQSPREKHASHALLEGLGPPVVLAPRIFPVDGSSSKWRPGTVPPPSRPVERPPSAFLARSSSSIWGSGEAAQSRTPRGSAGRSSVSAPAAEKKPQDAAAVLQTQVDFLKEVCRVPHYIVWAKGWADWRNDSAWTILHCMAEHLNNQRLPNGWLDAVQVEDFIGIFRRRGGNVDAVIENGPGQGYTALHMVAHREVMGGPAHDADIIRFVMR